MIAPWSGKSMAAQVGLARLAQNFKTRPGQARGAVPCPTHRSSAFCTMSAGRIGLLAWARQHQGEPVARTGDATTVNGIRIELIERGEGRPLLFLHPAPGIAGDA